MRRVKISVLILLFSACALTAASAQERTAQSKPAAAAQPNKIKTIFSYKKELGLSDKQVADMTGILTDFQKYLNDKGQEMREMHLKLNGRVKERAELKSIREILELISGIQVDVSYADIETSRRVEEILSPSQLKKWNRMQDAFRKEEAQARQLQQLQKEEKARQ